VSHLVYAAGREHVTHVFVNGELLVRDGVLAAARFSALDTRCIMQNALDNSQTPDTKKFSEPEEK